MVPSEFEGGERGFGHDGSESKADERAHEGKSGDERYENRACEDPGEEEPEATEARPVSGSGTEMEDRSAQGGCDGFVVDFGREIRIK